MKLKFDSGLEYQLDAINAVTDLLEGQPIKQSDFEITLSTDQHFVGTKQTELGVANDLVINEGALLSNLNAIQDHNMVEKSTSLLEQSDIYGFPSFSIEMETGTGKTYVYLRSIYELNKLYGLKKFIIVVPSVAIREGVTSSLKIMKQHFKNLYNNVAYDDFLYESKDVNRLKQFALGNEIQIMVINIQAFQKDAGDVDDYNQLTEDQIKKLNVIHREDDRSGGYRWIEYVQKTRPIVIIDEPQSVDNTAKAKKAIKTLSPLFALRYSATHINPYNLLYSLDPIKAYDLGLVKQIEVASIKADQNINETFIRLDSIGYQGKAKTPTAKATIFEDTVNGTREKTVKLVPGLDLSDNTNRTGYQGYIVDEIDATPEAEYVTFTNGHVLEPAEEEGGMADEVIKEQINQTVLEHFKKERNFQKHDKNIKVLSLFFIDKVDNYRIYDEDGNANKGKIAQWFEEAYIELSESPLFSALPKHDVNEVHDGYFSVDKKKGKVVALVDTKGTTKKDDETYELIMRDKERLLSEDEPLRFIFSHSALKEGWDNPNVFQICTLREFGSERERRQTLGRGLRLPVNSEGERVYDAAISKLTVIASESFEEYAKGLQDDMEKDMGEGFRFGRIQQIGFAHLVNDIDHKAVGQDISTSIWQSLINNGYMTEGGDITDKFDPKQTGFAIQFKDDLPDGLKHMSIAVSEEMKRYLFAGRVANAREKETVTYNKRVELNDDFKVLWDKINKKTRYKVEFTTEELIVKSLERIKELPIIKSLALTIQKTEVDINEAGVEAGRQVQTPRDHYIVSHTVLPDILAFLQRETELTRSTLVEILKQCGRLSEFKLNPQAFMAEVAKEINKALQDLVIDGIKYERLSGQIYEMNLFEQQEVEAYLSRLYEVKYQESGEGSDIIIRTPYDYIEYDSDVEKEVAKKLDEAENIKFYCKLPVWFKIPTPLGSYNPDWAIVTENDEKLYLVRETKSTHDSEKRRAVENKKIKCGQAHFDELGVNFKVATTVAEVVAE